MSTDEAWTFPEARRNVICKPPRKDLHRGGQLGKADYYPQSDRQPEDVLNAETVRHGFQNPVLVENEVLGSFRQAGSRQRHADLLEHLVGYFGEVSAQHSSVNTLASSQMSNLPRMNDRGVIVNDKVEAFWRALKGDESLHTIPRIHKTLPLYKQKKDMLKEFSERNIPVERATWFTKICILSEQSNQQKARNMRSDTIQEWTFTLTTWLKDSMMGLENTKKGTEPAGISLSRWQYALRLLHYQYDEGIINREFFLEFLMREFKDSSWMVSPLLSSVVVQYVGDYVSSTPLLRRLLLVCLDRLAKLLRLGPGLEQMRSFVPGTYGNHMLYCNLCAIIQVCVLEGPDCLLSAAVRQPTLALHMNQPPMRLLFEDMLAATTLPSALPPQLQQLLEDLVMGEEESARQRGEALQSLQQGSVPQSAAQQTSASTYPILDALDAFPVLEPQVQAPREGAKPQPSSQTLETLFQTVFNRPPISSKSSDQPPQPAWGWHASEQETLEVERVVHLLVEWATTVYRPGSYRVVVVVGLLALLHDTTAQIGNGGSTNAIHKLLASYLDKYAPSDDLTRADKDEEIRQLVLLYGELSRRDLFSHSAYMRMLVARPDFDRPLRAIRPVSLQQYLDLVSSSSQLAQYAKHMVLLQRLPVFSPYGSHARNQRRTLLYGLDPRGDAEELEHVFRPVQTIIDHLNSVPTLATTTPSDLLTATTDTFRNMQQAAGKRPLAVPLPGLITEQLVVQLGRRFTVGGMGDMEGDYLAREAVDRRLHLDGVVKTMPRLQQLDIVDWLVQCVLTYTAQIPGVAVLGGQAGSSEDSVSLLTEAQLGEVLRILEVAQAWEALWEVVGWVLGHTVDWGLVRVCVHALYRHWEALLSSQHRVQHIVGVLAAMVKGDTPFQSMSGPERVVALFVNHLATVMGDAALTGPHYDTAKRLCAKVFQYKRTKGAATSTYYPDQNNGSFTKELRGFPRRPDQEDVAAILKRFDTPQKEGIAQGLLQGLFERLETVDPLQCGPSNLQGLLAWADLCADINNRVYLNTVLTRLLKHASSSRPSSEGSRLGLPVFVVLLCARQCVLLEDLLTHVVVPMFDACIENGRKAPEGVEMGITLLQWLVSDHARTMGGRWGGQLIAQLLPEHHRLALTASARVLHLDTLVPALSRLCSLRRILADTPTGEQAQEAVSEIATTGWVRVRCLQDTERLYTEHLLKSRTRSDLTVADLRLLLRYLSYGTDDRQEGVGPPGEDDAGLVSRQVEQVFRHLNQWTFRLAKLDLQLLTDEWAERKTASSVQVDVERVIVRWVFERLVQETAKNSRGDVVSPFALCLTEKVQQRVVKETARWTDVEAWWAKPLTAQIQTEAHHGECQDGERLERHIATLLLPCLQRTTDESILAHMCSILLSQLALFNHAPPQAAVPANGLLLRLQMAAALIKPIVRGTQCTEWLGNVSKLLRREALRASYCMDPVVRIIADLLGELVAQCLDPKNCPSQDVVKQRTLQVGRLQEELCDVGGSLGSLCERIFPQPQRKVFTAVQVHHSPQITVQAPPVPTVHTAPPVEVVEDGTRGGRTLQWQWYGGVKVERGIAKYALQYALAQHHRHPPVVQAQENANPAPPPPPPPRPHAGGIILQVPSPGQARQHPGSRSHTPTTRQGGVHNPAAHQNSGGFKRPASQQDSYGRPTKAMKPDPGF